MLFIPLIARQSPARVSRQFAGHRIITTPVVMASSEDAAGTSGTLQLKTLVEMMVMRCKPSLKVEVDMLFENKYVTHGQTRRIYDHFANVCQSDNIFNQFSNPDGLSNRATDGTLNRPGTTKLWMEHGTVDNPGPNWAPSPPDIDMRARELEVLNMIEARKGRGKNSEPPAPPLVPPPNRPTPPTDVPTSQSGAHDDPVASNTGKGAGTNADYDSTKRATGLPLELVNRRKYAGNDAEEENDTNVVAEAKGHENFDPPNVIIHVGDQEKLTMYYPGANPVRDNTNNSSGARGSADYEPPPAPYYVRPEIGEPYLNYPEGNNSFRGGYATPEEIPDDDNAKTKDGNDYPDKASNYDSDRDSEQFGPHNIPRITNENYQRVSGLAHMLVRILRHLADSVKLFLDKFGYASIKDVLKLRCVVNAGGTKRDICCLSNKMFADKDGPIFEICASWTKIRAIQGHTVAISPYYAYMHIKDWMSVDIEEYGKRWAQVFMGAIEVSEMFRETDGMLPKAGMLPNDNNMYIKCYPIVGIEEPPRLRSKPETALVYALIDLKHFINRPEDYTVFKTYNDVMLISGVNDQMRLFRGQVIRFQDCSTNDIIPSNDLTKHVDNLIGDGSNPPRFAAEALDEALDDLIKRDKVEAREACINAPKPQTEEQKQWHRDYVKAILESRFKREPCQFIATKRGCLKGHLCTYQHPGDNDITIQEEITTITDRYNRKEIDKRLANQRYRPEPTKREITKADRDEEARRRSRSIEERERVRYDERERVRYNERQRVHYADDTRGSSRRYDTTRPASGSGDLRKKNDPRNYNTGRSKKENAKRSTESYETYTDSEEDKHGRYHRRR